jgi:hypothetical protein
MPMTPETYGKLFAAVIYPITEMWGDTLDDLQRMSLANQIVREIERRNIVVSVDAVTSERARCEAIAERIANSQDSAPARAILAEIRTPMKPNI